MSIMNYNGIIKFEIIVFTGIRNSLGPKFSLVIEIALLNLPY